MEFDFCEVSDDAVLLFFGHSHYLRRVILGFPVRSADLHNIGVHARTVTESEPFDDGGRLRFDACIKLGNNHQYFL